MQHLLGAGTHRACICGHEICLTHTCSRHKQAADLSKPPEKTPVLELFTNNPPSLCPGCWSVFSFVTQCSGKSKVRQVQLPIQYRALARQSWGLLATSMLFRANMNPLTVCVQHESAEFVQHYLALVRHYSPNELLQHHHHHHHPSPNMWYGLRFTLDTLSDPTLHLPGFGPKRGSTGKRPHVVVVTYSTSGPRQSPFHGLPDLTWMEHVLCTRNGYLHVNY